MSCFGTVILELRCLGYCISACFSLLFIYIINIGSRPWKPKDRPNEPECLSDPKYGVHKFASVNVNPTNWIKNPELLRLRMWCATTVKNAALGGTLGAGCWALCSMVRKCFCSPHSWKKKLCENHLKILERMLHHCSLFQGIRMHYVEAGDRNKPLILFVHGFPEFWYCWRHQITEFSRDFWSVPLFCDHYFPRKWFECNFSLTFRTVAVDLRGYNLTERPIGKQNYKMKNMVEDIRALIMHHLSEFECLSRENIKKSLSFSLF